MRFLYIILSVVWLSYGWVCYQAMRWEPARPAPRLYAGELSSVDMEAIDEEIEEWRIMLDANQLHPRDRTRARHRLSHLYVLKGFKQPNRTSQNAFFGKALKEALEAAKAFPDRWPLLWLQIADVHALLGDRAKAEEFYDKAIDIALEHQPKTIEQIEWHIDNLIETPDNGPPQAP